MKKCLVSAITVIASLFGVRFAPIQAASVDYGALGNFVQIPTGMLSATGNAVRVGTFTPGYVFTQNSTNYQATNSAFTQFDITAIGSGNNGAGRFFDSTPNLSDSVLSGQRLYIWAFNSPDPATSTAWVIVSNNTPEWVGPAGVNSTSIDTSDPGVFVPMGALGVIVSTTGPAGFDIRMTPVPEPSTYVLLALGLSALTFGAVRRRQAHGAQVS